MRACYALIATGQTGKMFFEKIVQARITAADIKEIAEIVKLIPKYESVSHFMRCAVIKLKNEEKDHAKRIREYRKHRWGN